MRELPAAHDRVHTGGRKAIPKEFPRKDIPHDIDEHEKRCPHDGSALERFGEEISERYGYRRPKIWIERHIRHRYGCPTCRRGEAIKIAPVPAQLLPKTNAGASLLAHLVANKFVDGIPIYRTCGQLERLGLDRTEDLPPLGDFVPGPEIMDALEQGLRSG